MLTKLRYCLSEVKSLMDAKESNSMLQMKMKQVIYIDISFISFYTESVQNEDQNNQLEEKTFINLLDEHKFK
jgi:hypothetical protein